MDGQVDEATNSSINDSNRHIAEEESGQHDEESSYIEETVHSNDEESSYIEEIVSSEEGDDDNAVIIEISTIAMDEESLIPSNYILRVHEEKRVLEQEIEQLKQRVEDQQQRLDDQQQQYQELQQRIQQEKERIRQQTLLKREKLRLIQERDIFLSTQHAIQRDMQQQQRQDMTAVDDSTSSMVSPNNRNTNITTEIPLTSSSQVEWASQVARISDGQTESDVGEDAEHQSSGKEEKGKRKEN